MSGQATGQTRTEEVHPVRAARKAMKLSVEGLAFKADVSAKTIERVERGEGTPLRATQRVIADVLGADPDVLFPENDDEPLAAA